MSVEYIKSAPNAMQPLHLTSGSAGSDLFSIVDKIINRGETFGIDFGLNFKIPKGYFGLISGRSSIALKGIMTHVGIIDEDFYGSGKVILTNVGLKPFRVSSGDRIGQVTLVKYSKVRWTISDSFRSEVFNWNFSDFQNKHEGFGSTGI